MSHKRIVQLQKNILMMIRAEVRKTIGDQPKDIRKYYEAYKREFRGDSGYSSRSELIQRARASDIILVGDYHTFAQSQRSALRLMKDLLDTSCPVALGVEMVRESDQSLLDAYLSGELNEEKFLSKLDYAKRWGFPWQNFQPLFAFAKTHKIPMLALNTESENLNTRDAQAARVIARYTKQNPDVRVVALYGDLHLARGHIPKKLRGEIKALGIKRRILTVFQNSESLYWRLAARRQEHVIDVLKLAKDRYCIISAAPWVKLQSYLQWAESSQLLSDLEDGAEDSDDGVDQLSLLELTRLNMKHLGEALQLSGTRHLDFQIHTVNNLAFLASTARLSELRREELKAIKAHVLSNRMIFIPASTPNGEHSIYLPSESINSICEAASVLLHAAASGTSEILFDPTDHFYQCILRNAIAYFGSKILNHKRKCDLEDDFRILSQRKISKASLRQEALAKTMAKIVLQHCEAQRRFLRDPKQGYRARPLPARVLRGPSRLSVFLEVTRNIGFLLGERLFASFAAGRIKPEKLHDLYSLKLNGDAASKKRAKENYFALLWDLQDAPITHTSKEEVF